MTIEDMEFYIDEYFPCNYPAAAEIKAALRRLERLEKAGQEMKLHGDNMLTRLKLYGPASNEFKGSEREFITAAKAWDAAVKGDER